MSIQKDISDLLQADVITPETAERIHAYYKSKSPSSTNRLFVVFGILGALLIGMGMILIIAHNWDELSRGTKTIFAFLPLLIGQMLCGFTIMKRRESIAWRESSSTFLFFAVGASIALVSQIYHIPGGTGTFLLTWMLLSLPLIYLMNSSVTSLLYICGITYYAIDLGYGSFPSTTPYFFWLLLPGSLPHYYLLLRKKPGSDFLLFHHWVIPISLIIALGTLAKSAEDIIFVAYVSLFGLFYSVGAIDFFDRQKAINNSYRILGSLGTIIIFLMLSFDWFWSHLRMETYPFEKVLSSPEFIASIVISLLAGVAFFFYQKRKSLMEINPISLLFLVFIVTFIVGLDSPFAVVLINLYVFSIGILTIREGARKGHLGILNFGLLVTTALVVCRFFDSDLNFVVRGLLFVVVGSGFFVANYWMLKKRKTNE